jgi:hypothetical protein
MLSCPGYVQSAHVPESGICLPRLITTNGWAPSPHFANSLESWALRGNDIVD